MKAVVPWHITLNSNSRGYMWAWPEGGSNCGAVHSCDQMKQEAGSVQACQDLLTKLICVGSEDGGHF